MSRLLVVLLVLYLAALLARRWYAVRHGLTSQHSRVLTAETAIAVLRRGDGRIVRRHAGFAWWRRVALFLRPSR